MWMRTFDTHELVMVAAPADAYSDQLTAMYGVLVWKPPAPASDLAGPVLDTMRGAFDALAGLL